MMFILQGVAGTGKRTSIAQLGVCKKHADITTNTTGVSEI